MSRALYGKYITQGSLPVVGKGNGCCGLQMHTITVTDGNVFMNPVMNIHSRVDTFLFSLFIIKIMNAPSGIHIVDAATSSPITARA